MFRKNISKKTVDHLFNYTTKQTYTHAHRHACAQEDMHM